MSYVISIRIPVEAYEKSGVDRDKFLKSVEENAKKFIPNLESVSIIKSVGDDIDKK
jgi:hypothetical protein